MSEEIKLPESIAGRVMLTRFWGGSRRGACVQITSTETRDDRHGYGGASFAQVRLSDLAEMLPALAEVCGHATAEQAVTAQAVRIRELVSVNVALLRACKAVYDDPYTTCGCADKLRAAIAQAEGSAA